MQRFSFTEKKEMLIPQTDVFKPPCDKDGKPYDGDGLLRVMGKIINTFEATKKIPVPIANQNFIQWIKQANRMMDEGQSSAQIFNSTLVKM